jgi:TM2 domain-containing membrane protein YozV
METIEPNNTEQNDSSSMAGGDSQPPVSHPEDVFPTQDSPLPGETPPALVCPHCYKEHTVGTLYCPVTGKPLAAAPLPSMQPQQAPMPAPVPNIPQQYPGAGQPQYPPPYNPNYPVRPPRDRNLALVLEILPGLFGILGIGWIYSGKTGTGLAWLIGYLVWVGIAIVAAVLSGALACFCTVPVNLLCVGISAYSLNNYMKSNPQLFGA